jgi:hypothetical protein
VENNSKIKSVSDLYRSINYFKDGYQPTTNIVKDEKEDLIADSHIFWLGGGTIFLSYLIFMGLMELGRRQYIQQNY